MSVPIISPSGWPVASSRHACTAAARAARFAIHKPAFRISRQFKKGAQLIGKSHHAHLPPAARPVSDRPSDGDHDRVFDLQSQSMPPSFRIGSNERSALIIRNKIGNGAGSAADNSGIQL
jgi:hypothetical protein